MKTNPVHAVLLGTVLAGSWAGCATTGKGSGVLEAPGKADQGEVVFVWRASADATHGTIRAVLPDGRQFAGEFIQITSAAIGQDLGVYGLGWRGDWYGASDGVEVVRNYSGQVIAQLDGPGDERMRCQFRLGRPEDGPASGGIGTCQLSNGEKIDYASLRGEND